MTNKVDDIGGRFEALVQRVAALEETVEDLRVQVQKQDQRLKARKSASFGG